MFSHTFFSLFPLPFAHTYGYAGALSAQIYEQFFNYPNYFSLIYSRLSHFSQIPAAGPCNFYCPTRSISTACPYNFHSPDRSIRHPPYKRKSRHIALAYGQHIPINFGACPTTSAPAYRNDTRHVNHPHPDLSSEQRRVRPSLIREVTASATALFNSLSIFRHKMPLLLTYRHPTFHRQTTHL